MQSRRGFIGILSKCAAVAGVAGVARPVPAEPAAPTKYARKGVPGKTYFKAGEPGMDLPPDVHVYCNGWDVNRVAYEADVEAGWVKKFHLEKDAGGNLRPTADPAHYESGSVCLCRGEFVIPLSKLRREGPA